MQRLVNKCFLWSGPKGKDNKKFIFVYRRRFNLKISKEKIPISEKQANVVKH